MSKRRVRLPKPIKNAKSSPAARDLLVALYGRMRSWRDVAKHIGLSHPAAAHDIATGKRKDTPAMRAYIKRAQYRARQAYLYGGLRKRSRPEPPSPLRLQLANVTRELNTLRDMIGKGGDDEQQNA